MIQIVEFVALGFGALLLLVIVPTVGIVVLLWTTMSIFQIPSVPQNNFIRKRLAELSGPNFVSTFQYIRGGAGIASDVTRKRVFLANQRGNKIYDMQDVTEVQPDFKTSQYGISGVLRLTVRDLENPLFEISGAFNGLTRLREIESAMSLMRSASLESDES
jgi:hypothetical protein